MPTATRSRSVAGGASRMACTRPLGGYRRSDGRVTFRRSSILGNNPNITEVACGQCNDCKITKAREWAARAMHEAQMHRVNSFITLTYNEESLPKDWSLDVKIWQRFAYRLRKEIGPFRFMHVGEYGEEGLRPHYHALIFGHNFEEDRAVWKEDPATGRRYYRSPRLAKLWREGFHDIQDLSREAANYVCQYSVKKIMGTSVEAEDRREKRYQRVDPETGLVWQVAEETWTMSRNPGIGATWYDKYGTDLFPRDEMIIKGKENRVPKFYTDRLEKANKNLWEEIKERRRHKAMEKAEENSPERRLVRETITNARLKVKKARKLD